MKINQLMVCFFLSLQVLNEQTFAIMVMMALFTTFITTPVVVAIYKPAQLAKAEYKHRTIERKESNTQIRMLICFQSTRNIPTLMNLMEVSRGTGKKGGLRVYAMHLMELSERSSAILMVHKARNNGLPFWKKQGDSDSDTNEVVVAFEAFQQLSHVSIRPTTAISPLSSMHEDICTSAEQKRCAIIILPFHKHQRFDGHLETTRADFRNVNRKVLERAPCSVGILVDRGLGGSSHVSASNANYTITAFFIGGRDDREALSYGALMAEHVGVSLNAVRFVVGPKINGDSVHVDVEDEEGGSDDEFVDEFKKRVSEDGSIKYEEIVVSNGVEIVNVIRTYNRCNLFIVGRMPEGEVVASLKRKSECPELGPVGNLLISPEFKTMASVLVVQQYRSQLTGRSLASLKEEYSSEEEEEDLQ